MQKLSPEAAIDGSLTAQLQDRLIRAGRCRAEGGMAGETGSAGGADADGFVRLRVLLLDLIAAVHDREADLGAAPHKSGADHAALAALFAARIGLQDQIVTLRKAEVLGRDGLLAAPLGRAVERMRAALALAADPQHLLEAARQGTAAARDLLAALRDDAGGR